MTLICSFYTAHGYHIEIYLSAQHEWQDRLERFQHPLIIRAEDGTMWPQVIKASLKHFWATTTDYFPTMEYKALTAVQKILTPFDFDVRWDTQFVETTQAPWPTTNADGTERVY